MDNFSPSKTKITQCVFYCYMYNTEKRISIIKTKLQSHIHTNILHGKFSSKYLFYTNLYQEHRGQSTV